MEVRFFTHAATLTLVLAGAACARNSTSDDQGAAAAADTTAINQTESGVTDSSGQSTMGPGVERTRPDQGQPVTSKGDTVNMGVDSATTGQTGAAQDSSSMTGQTGAAQDSGATGSSDSSAVNQTESGVTDSSGQSTLGPGADQTRPDQGQPVTSKGDTINMGVDSSTTAR